MARKSPVSQMGPTMEALTWGPGALHHRPEAVIGAVEAGAGQVVHAGVHDDEMLGVAGLGVEHLGHQDAGVAHQHPPGLQDEGALEALQVFQDLLPVLVRVGRRLVVVLNPQAAAQVQVADAGCPGPGGGRSTL